MPDFNLRNFLETNILPKFKDDAKIKALRLYFGFEDGIRHKHTEIVKLTGVNRSTTYALPEKVINLISKSKEKKYFKSINKKFLRILRKHAYLANDEIIAAEVEKNKSLSAQLKGTNITVIGEILVRLYRTLQIFNIKKKQDKKIKFHKSLLSTWWWTLYRESFCRNIVIFLTEALRLYKSPVDLEELAFIFKKMPQYKEEVQVDWYYNKPGIFANEEEFHENFLNLLKQVVIIHNEFELLDEKVFLKKWVKTGKKNRPYIAPNCKLYLFTYVFRKQEAWTEFEKIIYEANKIFGSRLQKKLTKKDFQRRESNKKYFIKLEDNTRDKIWGLLEWKEAGSISKAKQKFIETLQTNFTKALEETDKVLTRWKTKPKVDKFIDEVLKEVNEPTWTLSDELKQKYLPVPSYSGDEKHKYYWGNLAYHILKVNKTRMNLLNITELAIKLKAYLDKKWQKKGKTPHITILGELTYRDKDGKFADFGNWNFGLREWIEKSARLLNQVLLCPVCGKEMHEDWKVCPYDGTALR